jgi:tetratricopeptide (TPR) repeat protein
MAEVIGSDLGHKKKQSRWRTLAIVGGILVLAGGAGVGLRLLQNKADNKDKDGQQLVGQPLAGDTEAIQNLRVSGSADEADKKIDEALKGSSLSEEERYLLYIQRGSLAVDNKDLNGAIAAYLEAYELRVTFESTELLADTYAQAGNKSKAIEFYKKALPLVPATPVQDEEKASIEAKIAELEK